MLQHEHIVDNAIDQLWDAACSLCLYARAAGGIEKEWEEQLHSCLDSAAKFAMEKTPEEALAMVEQRRGMVFGNENP